MNRYVTPRYYLHQCQQWYRLLCLFNRRDELERLIAWARQKRLRYPLALYETHRAETERLLWHSQRHYPTRTRLVRVVHWMKTLFFGTPRYLPKGAASFYRRGTYYSR